jgi:site-specific DNA recombinase
MAETLAVGYVRVSTEEQTQGWSLTGQEAQIRDFAERNGYKIVAVYTDEVSGSKDKRPGFERMLLDAHNRAFQAIIVVNTSRLFRNLALARRYKDLLRNKLNIDVIFVSQPNMDPNDPSSFIMEAMNELFDEYYLHQLRFWTTLGKQTRAQKGLWNGTLPFGYITGDEGKPIPHPTNAKGLKLAFEAYATGNYSDKQIAELLNREGYRTTGNWGERLFTKDTVNRMLRNVFYLGMTKYRDALFPGVHEAIIDQELFDKCAEVRAGRRSHARAMGETKRIYLFSGVARCHVCQLTLRCMATQSGGQWRYYRHVTEERGLDCAVAKSYIRADKLEEEWSRIVSRIRLPANWQQRIEELAGDADTRATILKERAEVEERLRRLTQLYKDLLVDEAEYRETRTWLKQQLALLTVPENTELIQAAEYLESLQPLWAAASLEERRTITRMMVQKIYIDIVNERILSITPAPAFAMLLRDVCLAIGVDIVA